MVFESTKQIPDARGRRAHLAAAAQHLRLPEARVRVLREGRAPSSTASPTRSCARSTASASASAARARRQGSAVGQRQARDEPRRPRPHPEDREGPGPAPHPRRRHPGAALHLRRRPRRGHPHRDRAPEGAERRLQPRDRRVDDGPRARRGDLEEARSRASRSATSRTRRSSTTCRCASPTRARRARCSGYEAKTSLGEMLDVVIPWVVEQVAAGTI